ncbi:uncharacterized protein [Blastocystis hominis]|uniref:RNA helicase n=1 Tax=Blastocystis hominis TaxID=12968 RepID=D8M0F4_BLAHO|nr:uncharacterized protein [Blastocystis hominis]CBK21543.2 unnamed protein product [Blastocystis hominis]|eukprot:XP_012895591.1 uncharacterized protein [Blastocystis hominis]
MADDFIMTIPDEGEEENMVFKEESSSESENEVQETKGKDFTKGFVFDADNSGDESEQEDVHVERKLGNDKNSKIRKLDERIRKKREEYLNRRKQEGSKDKDESGDEDEDAEEEINGKTGEEEDKGDDVIRSVQSVKGKPSKLPSNEEFWAEESQPSSSSSSSSSSATLARSFNQLRLSRPLLRAVNEMGFTTPTPIQARCIPLALAGKDICAAAKTGSGKTAAYLLPILERLLYKNNAQNLIRVLIVAPTRELAQQVHTIATKLTKYTSITCCLVVGGLPLQAQAVDLQRRPDIVVCTPGRMIDHVHNSMSVDLDDVEVVILDEADRLLELGFTEELHELLRLCPVKRQTLLFSATMTDDVSDLISLSLQKPVRVFVDPVNQVVDRLVQFIRVKDESLRTAMLLSIITRHFKTETIIFAERKAEAHLLHIILGLLGLKSAELHGNLNQTQRLRALDRFSKKEVDFLIATDVAARGLDIKGVQTVINLHMPKEEATYIHRVGRTARAGHAGRAVTFVEEDRRLLMKKLVKQAVEAKQQIKTRSVNKESVAKFAAQLEDLKKEIDEILEEEKVEKEIERATMEATRADNLIKHGNEIKARKKRTWFQSEKEKKTTRMKDLASKKAKNNM